MTTAVDNTGAESVYSNQAVVALPNGISQAATVSLIGQSATLGWLVVGVGDFNSDGHADVLWFNANTGTLLNGYWTVGATFLRFPVFP